jgi:hypothetical protein
MREKLRLSSEGGDYDSKKYKCKYIIIIIIIIIIQGFGLLARSETVDQVNLSCAAINYSTVQHKNVHSRHL